MNPLRVQGQVFGWTSLPTQESRTRTDTQANAQRTQKTGVHFSQISGEKANEKNVQGRRSVA